MKEMVQLIDNQFYFTSEEEEAIKDIFSSDDPSQIINSRLAYRYLEYLLKNSPNPELYESLSTSDRLNFIRIILLSIRHIYQRDLENEFNTFTYEYDKEKQVSHKLNYLYNMTGIIHNWSNKSRKFAVEYSSIKNAISTLFELVGHKSVINRVVDLEKSINKSSANYVAKSLFRNCLVALYNLSYLEYLFQDTWRDVRAYENLITVAKLAKMYPDLNSFYFVSLLMIANVFRDSEVSEHLIEFKMCIKSLSDLWAKCIRNLGTDSFYKLKMNVYEKDDRVFDVTFVDEHDTKWNFVEISNALYRFSVNDSLKEIIYFDYSVKELILQAIANGSEVEKDFAIKLLWQLCFNRRVAQDFLEREASLIQTLRNLLTENRDRVDNKRLLVDVANFIYYLKAEYRSNPTELKANAALNQNHVFISYHNDQKEFCSTIKTELERQNFKVAAHLDMADHLNLEKSFHVIEGSRHVLILMSERYKQDLNCRAEAEHARRIEKNLVPVISQSGYKPTGWLSNLIVNSVTVVDAPNMPIDDCIRRIVREVAVGNKSMNELDFFQPITSSVYNLDSPNHTNTKPPPAMNYNTNYLTSSQTSMPNTAPPPPNIIYVNNNQPERQDTSRQQPVRKLNWTEQDVKRWANEKNLSPEVTKNILPCDGHVLQQYYLMLNNVPEFFFSSLNSNGNKVSLRDSGHFVSELRKLFD